MQTRSQVWLIARKLHRFAFSTLTRSASEARGFRRFFLAGASGWCCSFFAMSLRVRETHHVDSTFGPSNGAFHAPYLVESTGSRTRSETSSAPKLVLTTYSAMD